MMLNIITLIDGNDPLSEICQIYKFESDGKSWFEASVKPRFISKYDKPTLIFDALEAYQDEVKSYLPASLISPDTIHQNLNELNSAFKKIYKTLNSNPIYQSYLKLQEKFTERRRLIQEKYPEHSAIEEAYIAALKEDKDAFYDFVRELYPKIKDPKVLGEYASYVWESIETLWHTYPEEVQFYRKIKNPRSYIAVSAYHERGKVERRHKEDPFKTKLKDEIYKELVKLKPDEKPEDLKKYDLQPLLLDTLIPFDGYAENFTFNDFEGLKYIENILAVRQAYNAMKDLSPERRTELVDLFIARYLFDIPRYAVGALLGWPEDRVHRVWRFLNLHKEHVQKLIPKKVIIS